MPATDLPSVSEVVRGARARLGCSQQAFAARLGTCPAAASRWERGRAQPAADRLLALLVDTGLVNRRDLDALAGRV